MSDIKIGGKVIGFINRGGLSCSADGDFALQNDIATNVFTIDVDGSAEIRVVNGEIGIPNTGTTGSFSVYNVGGPGDTNYERLQASFVSNVAAINVDASGTGTQRDLSLRLGGATYCQLSTTEFKVWRSLVVNSAAYSLGSPTNPWNNIYLRPSSSLTPSANGDLCIEATNNTTLTFKYKGSDGTIRFGTVPLTGVI